ncbi:nuclear polyadenylated RNA-binding protein 3 [Basidiobolus ranarum]|uniref:Nuclear polyadenylated RNA-binding protein 3 n=1 Tax=Basidiobolus ranarum TaxID=34480 RepID=A0ABR2W051_9FUNG
MVKRSFGTIQFLTTSACSDAIANENGRIVQGLRIDLRVFEPHRRPEKRKTRRGGRSSRKLRMKKISFRERGKDRKICGKSQIEGARDMRPSHGYPSFHRDRRGEHGSNYDSSAHGGESERRHGESHRYQSFNRDYKPPLCHVGGSHYGEKHYESHENHDGYPQYRHQDPFFQIGRSNSMCSSQVGPHEASVSPSNLHSSESLPGSEFFLPKRCGGQIPFCQIIVLDEIDREFIWHVENSLRGRSISAETLFISPKLSLSSVIRQLIMEGVHVVIFIEKQHQTMKTISLQIFHQKSRVGDNVRFDAYDNISVNEALEVMVRHRITLRALTSASISPNTQPSAASVSTNGIELCSSQQQLPQPTQPQYHVNPLIGAGGDLNFDAIASLLRAIQGQSPISLRHNLAGQDVGLHIGDSNPSVSSDNADLHVPVTVMGDSELLSKNHQISPTIRSKEIGRRVVNSDSQISNSNTEFNTQSWLAIQQPSDLCLRGNIPSNPFVEAPHNQPYMNEVKNQLEPNNSRPIVSRSGVNRSGASSSDSISNDTPEGQYNSQQLDYHREYSRHIANNGLMYSKELDCSVSLDLRGTVVNPFSRPTLDMPVSEPPGSVNELLIKLQELQNQQINRVLNRSIQD